MSPDRGRSKETRREVEAERMSDLVVTGLSKSYGAVPALAGIDLSVAAGEFFVVLGPSFGPGGYEAVDVSNEEPWASMRRR